MKAINVLLALLAVACATPKQDADPVREKLLASLPEFRKCYSHTDLTRPSGLTLGFDITANGTPTNSKVLKSDFDEQKNGCFLKVVDALTFEKPAGGTAVTVTQPLTFYPQ